PPQVDVPPPVDMPTGADIPAEADFDAAAGPSSADDHVRAPASILRSPADVPAAVPTVSGAARLEEAAQASPQNVTDTPVPADGAIALARSGEPSARRDPAIARLDWTGLGEAVAGCRACGLCEGRRNTVFGVGPRPASWMLVGEAPCEQEDLQGEPFVGPAGRLLDQMLEAIAVDRPSQAFIANVLKCRPPRNRDPMPEEVARCEPYLLRQVELLRPRLIVVLGRFAAQSLLRTDASIASLRGRVHRYRAGDREVPMIVTYHPAYLLRNLPDKSKSWADLRLARRTWDASGGEGG
ncbi:MAG: uracil-DNA glycosylase, partial [Burkholderiales bacterium]